MPRVAIHQSHAAAIQREIQAVVRTFAVFLGHLLPRRLNVSPPRFRPRSSVSLRFLAVLHPPTPRAPHRDPYGIASRFRARTFLRPFADLHPNLSGYLAADASRHVAEIEPRRSYATRTWKRRRGSMRREFPRIQRRVRSLFVRSFHRIKSYVARLMPRYVTLRYMESILFFFSFRIIIESNFRLQIFVSRGKRIPFYAFADTRNADE